jgi:NADH-quinone oxidoreductase subunit N
MPLFIISAGALTILLNGAFVPGRHGTWIGAVAAIGAALWALQTPPQPVAPLLGLAATPFARFFTVLFCITAAAALLLSHSYNDRWEIRGEEYPATVLFALFGMSVLAASVNLLTLFLGLESLTFAFYILTAIDRERPRSVEAGMKYLLMGASAAAFIAFGIALFYGGTGTLEIAKAVQPVTHAGSLNPLVIAGWGFLLTGMAFKLSLAPAHLWTPDVYQGAPPGAVAFLSTGSKAAAFAALVLLFQPLQQGWSCLHGPLWALSFLSMTVGNLAALRQRNLRRMLAYSSISQMGYVALALLTGTSEGFAALIFYLVAYTATNLSAFGTVASLAAEGFAVEEIDDLRGIGRSRQFRGGVLALALFSLAGIPLTAGFVGKFAVFAAAFRKGEIGLAIIGVVMAAISVYYYLRVAAILYGRSPGPPLNLPRLGNPEAFALAAAGLTIVFLGVFPDRLLLIIRMLVER